MKFSQAISIISIWLLAQSLCLGKDSAYKALRVLGNERGSKMLEHVVEVQGRNGTPQPSIWKIILDDPSARGGVREFEVEGGRINFERTPVRGYSGVGEGAVMDLKKLNLDSEGAFQVAEKEAVKAKAGFDKVDYTLRSGEDKSPPVWIVNLLNARQKNVGTVQIAADTGNVLMKHFPSPEKATGESAPAPEQTTTVAHSQNPNAPKAMEWTAPRIGHEVKKHVFRIGGTFQEFFTGHRTVDQDYWNER